MKSAQRGRYHKDGELQHRLNFAHNIGWGRGYHDKHEERRNFETGAEWLAWLAGWREGQAQRLGDLQAEAAATERLDCIMHRMLGSVSV